MKATGRQGTNQVNQKRSRNVGVSKNEKAEFRKKRGNQLCNVDLEEVEENENQKETLGFKQKEVISDCGK